MDEKGHILRLDKFLYFIRLAKTRAKSAAMIKESAMRIDGKAVTTAHVEVRVGNTITLTVRNQVRAIRVRAIPVRRGPATEAQACYQDMIAPEPIDEGYR